MRKSVLQIVILVLGSILFGFLLAIIPSFFDIVNVSSNVLLIMFIGMFVSFFVILIIMYIHSFYLIRKSRFISTLIPLRMYESITDNGMAVFFSNMQKLVRATQRSLIYITYPIDRFEVFNNKYVLYTKEYYNTKPGKELKAFHKEITKFINKIITTDNKRMYFKLYFQNIMKRPENVDNVSDSERMALAKDKLFSKVNDYKKALQKKDILGSVIESYNIFSEQELIVLISDNSHMLLLVKMLDKYVSSFVKDPSTVKDFVNYIHTKIPQ